ncbi:MAG TPA: nuclear transport factor 2 family protein [Candidatus Binatia bacterium]|nr:nuclear transport factor 2 family protein [Candidatus Binatia bacterium]
MKFLYCNQDPRVPGRVVTGEMKGMSRAEETTKNDSAQVRALVNRQVQAWEKRDFAITADDWLPNGELFSPGGHVVKKDMQSAMLAYFKNFSDLKVTVNEMFLSEDGTRLAIQWDWTVTRKRDGKRATTHDAILVHLVGGKIATWNEYFG